MLLVQGGGELAVLPAVTAVLLHHSAIYTWTECNVVSTGWRGNSGSACSYCSTITSQCYIYTWTECNVVSTGWRGIGGSACSYCSTVTSLCYIYMD